MFKIFKRKDSKEKNLQLIDKLYVFISKDMVKNEKYTFDPDAEWKLLRLSSASNYWTYVHKAKKLKLNETDVYNCLLRYEAAFNHNPVSTRMLFNMKNIYNQLMKESHANADAIVNALHA